MDTTEFEIDRDGEVDFVWRKDGAVRAIIPIEWDDLHELRDQLIAILSPDEPKDA